MSEFGTCPKCGEYAWLPRHQCKPVWRAVLIDDLEGADEFDLWREVRARTADEAAEVYAQTTDREEATFTEGTQQIAVRSPDGVTTFWEVAADLEPVYWAEPFTPDDA